MHHPLAFAFGILGNVISFMVYLAPVDVHRICKSRSTEGFQAVPYVVALFSAMLMIYYALIKTNSYLLITINGTGCFIETVYIALFLIFAPRKAKISAFKLLVLLNVASFGIIVGLTLLLLRGSTRVTVIGWVNVGFSVCVFAAPLSIMRLVIRTKSVEFMPFFLSFFLTVSAVVWFIYGFLIRDLYVAAPNILGFLFGVAQMVLYLIYRRRRGKDPEKAMPSAMAGSEVHPIEISIEVNVVGATGAAQVDGRSIAAVRGDVHVGPTSHDESLPSSFSPNC
ncbi:unnamed protein product [Spirodela intermedia]|uniref:Bidirectional sugar transporter SWEET n=1 Tax=Spirodela intermedia TaxID=51605 RepID=A0A7I8JDN6_SPIIN|nr:unnamed protein product [Spirodela intermedia]CAA6667845.1 unnamed protein product [Spirodela intermedia]